MTTGNELRIEAAQWLLLLDEEPEDNVLHTRFEAWLDADPAHVLAWARISDTDAAIMANPPAMKITLASPSIPAVCARRSVTGWRYNPGWRRMTIAILAASLAAIMAAPTVLLHMQADYVTGAGTTRNIALPDGSRVKLGPASAIAISYTPGRRDVRLLTGQGWFEVARNPQRPFRVTSAAVTATALGTGFDVRRIGNTIRVDVGHGRVRVARDERDTAAPVLTAGQWISFTPGHRPETGSEQVALLGAWPSGELVARECTIAEVIDKLRPWYGGRILLLDHAIGQRRVSGFYNAHDPIDALRTIVHPHGGTVTRVTPWLLIISS